MNILLNLIIYISICIYWIQIPIVNGQILPQVVDFIMDLQSGSMTLQFDQIVQSKHFDVTKIGLQNKIGTNPDSVFRFEDSNNDIGLQGNVTTILFYVNLVDYNRFAYDEFTAQSLETSYLTLDNYLVDTVDGVWNTEYNQTNAILANTYRKDSLEPQVVSFNLNMDLGLLDLIFTEPIDVDSFTVVGLQVQNKENAGLYDGVSVKLVATGVSVLSYNNSQYRIYLDIGFINSNLIKEELQLATMGHNTYLSAWTTFVNDTHVCIY
jgi:hypothetical protein